MRCFENPDIGLMEGSRDSDVPGTPQANWVRELQSDLNSLGYAAGKADGIFGPRTAQAIINFQKDAAGKMRREQDSLTVCGRITTEDGIIGGVRPT